VLIILSLFSWIAPTGKDNCAQDILSVFVFTQ